eukprot:scaffold47753_cov58-Attheya_sp.AAC.1
MLLLLKEPARRSSITSSVAELDISEELDSNNNPQVVADVDDLVETGTYVCEPCHHCCATPALAAVAAQEH